MNFEVLPDFLAIGALVVAFGSLLKRTGQNRLRYWLLGWVLVLAHIAAQFVAANVPAIATGATAASVVMLLWTSMTFIWAGRDPVRPTASRELLTTLLAATPDTLFYICLIYGVTRDSVYYTLTAAGLVATLWLFGGGQRAPERRRRYLLWAAVVLVYVLQGALLWADRADMALNWSLFWHYLAAALFFRLAAPGASVGVRFTTLSFVAWALVFPVGLFFDDFLPHVLVEREVWNLPKFLVATGLIFTLLEEQMAKAEHASLHDALTGLPNRRLFLHRLRQAIEQTRRHGRPLAVLVIDLNDFKQVNDSQGHAVGDELLQGIAERFRRCMRHGDTLARLGGDEFAAILADVGDRDSALRTVDKLRVVLEAPFQVDGLTLRASASIGLSLFPEDGADERLLYAFADRDMYRDKSVVRPRGALEAGEGAA